jgi:hypothetical protein
VLGVRPAAITYEHNGKQRSATIPNVLNWTVRPAQNAITDQEPMWVNVHPFNPAGVAFAVGETDSTWSDYGMRWDNSGKNGHYAPINWSNS